MHTLLYITYSTIGHLFYDGARFIYSSHSTIVHYYCSLITTMKRKARHVTAASCRGFAFLLLCVSCVGPASPLLRRLGVAFLLLRWKIAPHLCISRLCQILRLRLSTLAAVASRSAPAKSRRMLITRSLRRAIGAHLGSRNSRVSLEL